MSSQQRGIKFNDNETTRFLALYSTEKVLYDQTLDGYRDRDLREAAANRISRALKIPGLGPKEVITKFKNLRSSYCQELKKIADSVRSGKGAAADDNVYKPKVFWFEQMHSFIRPFVQQRPTQSNPQLFPKENSEEAPKKCSEEAPTENSQHSELKFERSAGNSIEDTSTQIDTPRKTVKRKTEPQPSTSKNRITTRDYEMGFLKSAIDKLQENISNRASRVAINKDDSYDHFGRYIASMLRDIGPPTAIRLQQNITNMITNAMCQQEYLTADHMMSGRTSAASGRQSSTFSAGDDEDYDV